jgi:hypothetical protein
MTRLIAATYDGSALRLDEPLPLEPNTRVFITVHSNGTVLSNGADHGQGEVSPEVSFFDIALSMDLDGPPDWSARIDHYLYGVDDGK